jgi:hypothetical protein
LEHIRQVPPDLLAQMGDRAAGGWLRTLVSVDAVLVLSGAVLTSYVGVVGLIRRMALDRCLPKMLLRTNERRGTNHYIILSFFLVCCSILLATRGHVGTLAGVYTLSFLSVMALFALGNMLLKVKRQRLPRAVKAGWLTVAFALVAVVAGLIGNVLLDPRYVQVFVLYFASALAIVGVMLLRVTLLRVALAAFRAFFDRIMAWNQGVSNAITEKIQQVNARPIIYFTRGDQLEHLNRAALYVLENEQTSHLMVVHVHEPEHAIPPDLAEQLAHIDKCYPQLRIDFLAVEGKFGPELIELLSVRLAVPKNYMFIGTPSDRFNHRVEQLGGVRLIM